jgi:ADP-ribose pyrophosphatase YjhB (NUDIX family)
VKTHSTLTSEEWQQWSKLTERIQFENKKIPLEAFHAWSEAFYTIAVELVPFRRKESGLEILLINRNDKYFKGYHTPGAILTPGETVSSKMDELVERELGLDPKNITPVFIKNYDLPKGKGTNENPRGQTLNIVFACLIEDEVKDGEWFRREDMPANLLKSFNLIIPETFEWAEKNFNF